MAETTGFVRWYDSCCSGTEPTESSPKDSDRLRRVVVVMGMVKEVNVEVLMLIVWIYYERREEQRILNDVAT